MMNDTAQKSRFGIELPAVRRFELGDITRHAKWLLPRLIKQYPHLNERTAIGFLNNMLYNSEYYFCFQPNAAGLAQVERAHMLTPDAIVREKFVWCENPKDIEHIEQAAAFYIEFDKWGARFGARIMIVGEATDVPPEKIREVFGKRIFTREQSFVRLQ